GRLRGERRGARHTRVHLDHDEAPVVRVDRELDIRATRLDTDLPHDGDRGVAHQLVFLVRQRLCRRDGDRVSRVDPNGVHVLDGADDDDVIREVAHHLELELLPADHRLLDEHGRDGRRLEPPADRLVELVRIVGDRAARAAERERGPDDRREADPADDRARLVEGPRVARARQGQADALHRFLEELAVLGFLDRGELGADQLDAEALERAVLAERDREVQPRLAAERGQQRVGTLTLDDLRDELGRERLHIGALGELRVGHDRGGVRVDEDDLEPLLAERLRRLRARIVELARLADDDRPRADDQDLSEIGAPGHYSSTRPYTTEVSGAASQPWRATDSGSTANPWFWAVISTLSVTRSFTGWFAPWWPNLSLYVRPPPANPMIW